MSEDINIEILLDFVEKTYGKSIVTNIEINEKSKLRSVIVITYSGGHELKIVNTDIGHQIRMFKAFALIKESDD